jgi:hypothetical protein
MIKRTEEARLIIDVTAERIRRMICDCSQDDHARYGPVFKSCGQAH